MAGVWKDPTLKRSPNLGEIKFPYQLVHGAGPDPAGFFRRPGPKSGFFRFPD